MRNTLLYPTLAACACVSIYLGFFHLPMEERSIQYSKYGYWTTLFLLILSVVLLSKTVGKSAVAWTKLKENQKGLIFCLLCSLFLFTREDINFKIVYDEPLLSNIALSMHEERKPIYTETSLHERSSASEIDKRPALFPVIVSVLHDITGYRVSNAFYLNGFLTFLLLCLLFLIVKSTGGTHSAYLAIMLATASPLIGENSSGGGFEILNAVGIMLVVLLANKYFNQPSKNTLATLFFACALLANIRYESAFFIVPAVVAFLIRSFKDRATYLSYKLALIPVLLIPLAWQQTYTSTHLGYQQFNVTGDGLFSFNYVLTNFDHAINFLLALNSKIASTTLLGIISFLSIAVALPISFVSFFKARNQKVTVHMIFSLFILLHLLLIFCFTYGQLDEPIVSRLGIPALLLSFALGSIAITYITDRFKFKNWVPISIGLACIAVSFSKYPQISIKDSAPITNYAEWIIEHHNSLPRGNYLYITHIGRFLELQHIPNISHNRAITGTYALDLHSKLKTFDRIFVVQAYTTEFTNENGREIKMLPGNNIGNSFELRNIQSIRTTPLNFVTLSEVIDIDYDRESFESEYESLVHRSHTGATLLRPISTEELELWSKSLP